MIPDYSDAHVREGERVTDRTEVGYVNLDANMSYLTDENQPTNTLQEADALAPEELSGSAAILYAAREESQHLEIEINLLGRELLKVEAVINLLTNQDAV